MNCQATYVGYRHGNEVGRITAMGATDGAEAVEALRLKGADEVRSWSQTDWEEGRIEWTSRDGEVLPPYDYVTGPGRGYTLDWRGWTPRGVRRALKRGYVWRFGKSGIMSVVRRNVGVW